MMVDRNVCLKHSFVKKSNSLELHQNVQHSRYFTGNFRFKIRLHILFESKYKKKLNNSNVKCRRSSLYTILVASFWTPWGMLLFLILKRNNFRPKLFKYSEVYTREIDNLYTWSIFRLHFCGTVFILKDSLFSW